MRILAIGDPHGKVKKDMPKKNIDLILLTGDIGKANLVRKLTFENKERKQEGLPELKRTIEQEKKIHSEIHNSTIGVLKKLSKIAPTYTLQGNVGIYSKKIIKEIKRDYDIVLSSTLDKIKTIPYVYLTKNRLRILQGLRVGFLEYFLDVSWVKEFKPRDYAKEMNKARKQSNKAKNILERFGYGLDILLCHQPPYGVLDKVSFEGAPKAWKGKHAGSKVILSYIKRYHPNYVICGHIHEAAGERKIGKTKVINLGERNYRILELT